MPSWVPSYITAQDIMKPSVVCLPMVCSLQTLIGVLNSNEHSAFPVLGHPVDRPRYLHLLLKERAANQAVESLVF